MTAADIDNLLQYLEVERIDRFLFTGKSPERPRRIFGGQVLAQSLNAAIRSVEGGRIAHSMHAYFLRPGNPEKQIVFEVDPIRDGRSFATRRVVAKQDGVPIFNTSISFQFESGGLEHQADMPDAPAPETLLTDEEYWQEMHSKDPKKYSSPLAPAIERRVVDRRDYEDPQPREARQMAWFRTRAGIGDDPALHQVILAFMSDFALLGAALLPHPYTVYSPDMMAASLDHAIWFHRSARADDYLLYVLDSPNAGGSRGFSRGQFFSTDGRLVASTAQESLIRLRDR
jgi:acyl-CoA thioesterase-2